MANRSLEVIYSDDVRHEVSGKISYIGCYNSQLWVQSFPLTLPKLCVSMWARIPHSNLPKHVTFRLLKDTDVLFEQESDVPQPQSTWDLWEGSRPADMEMFTALSTTIIFSPMVLEEPCYLRVRAFTDDGEELKAPALRIMEAPQEFKDSL